MICKIPGDFPKLFQRRPRVFHDLPGDAVGMGRVGNLFKISLRIVLAPGYFSCSGEIGTVGTDGWSYEKGNDEKGFKV
jgi:hypothetical protein